jgi:translation machinery-associated protein 16
MYIIRKFDALSEVPDLTHAPTVEVFRRWDQKEVAFTELLRFIRIFSTQPDMVVVSKPGKHLSITGPNRSIPADEDDPMNVETDLS